MLLFRVVSKIFVASLLSIVPTLAFGVKLRSGLNASEARNSSDEGKVTFRLVLPSPIGNANATHRSTVINLKHPAGITPATEHGSTENPVACTLPSYLADPHDCTKYFYCLPTPSGFQVISLDCIVGYFSQSKSKCVSGTPPCKNQTIVTPKATVTPRTVEEVTTPEPEIHDETNAVALGEENLEPDTEIEHVVIPAQEDSHNGSNDLEEFAETLQLEETSHAPPESTPYTRQAAPKVWFGLSKTPSGNPFKDEDTSLALILDFSSSKLQIYSRNVPRK